MKGTNLRIVRRNRAKRLALAGALTVALTCASSAAASVSHTVEPGETLWSLAAASNLTTRALAAANGLPDDAFIVAGSEVQIPSEAEAATALGLGEVAPVESSSAPPVQAASAQDVVVPPADPGQVTAAEIGQVAAAHGVAPDLAAALAWQESGFNNGLVSSANAMGVMQVLPNTWSWVETNLAGRSLDANPPGERARRGAVPRPADHRGGR